MLPTVNELTRVHRTHRAKSEQWEMLTRILESETTQEDKKRLLVHPDNRPEALKDKRAEVARVAPILTGLATKLQSQIMRSPGVFEPFVTGTTRISNDPLWAEFVEDCTGEGESLHKVLSTGLLQGLGTGLCFFQVDTLPAPKAQNRAEQRELGGDRPFVILRNRSEIVDWHKQGRYGMIKLRSREYMRDSWKSAATPSYLYQVYQRYPDGSVTSQKWRILPKSDSPPDDWIPGSEDRVKVEQKEVNIFHLLNGKYRFPVITLKIDPQLVLGIQLYEVYSQYVTQMAAINYASLISLWRQLYFTNTSDPAVITRAIGEGVGDGFWWALPPGVEARWLEIDTAGLQFALDYAEKLKGEMYEQVAQIAASAAASYAGIHRSAASKEADQRNMNILLYVYGAAVRKAAKQIFDCAGIARGEDLNTSVVGFNKYDLDRLEKDVEEYLAVSPIFQSRTFDVAAKQALAGEAMDALGLPTDLLPPILAEIKASSGVEEEDSES